MTTETLEPETVAKSTAADRLRLLADWLDAHHSAEAELMSAEVGRHKGARLIFYHVSVLAAAFPGRECTKKLYQSSDVYSLSDGGIDFEAWQKCEPDPATESKVTL